MLNTFYNTSQDVRITLFTVHRRYLHKSTNAPNIIPQISTKLVEVSDTSETPFSLKNTYSIYFMSFSTLAIYKGRY